MRSGHRFLGVSLLLLSGAGLAALAPHPVLARHAPRPAPGIEEFTNEKLDDFTAIMKVTFHDENAGRKINKDFGLMYKIDGDITVRYKEPNRLRLDGRIKATKATLINTGEKQIVRLSIGLNTSSNLGDSPGKRKTLLDVGMISKDYLSYTLAEPRGERMVEGVKCAVYKISYKNKDLDTSHRMVWLDPKTKLTLKREEYTQDGKLSATFYYRNPKEFVPGLWFPTLIEVFNNENKKAGATSYKDLKVNQGLSNDLFK